MDNKTRAAMELALEALEESGLWLREETPTSCYYIMCEAITAMCEVLGENNGKRSMDGNSEHSVTGSNGNSSVSVEALEQPSQEPTVSDGVCGGCAKKASDGWALYCVKCWEKAQPVSQEPVAFIENGIFKFNIPSVHSSVEKGLLIGKHSLYTAPQPVKQEPVAYMVKSEGFIYSLVNRISAAEEIVSMLRKDDQGAAIHPLYTRPVRTKDLTDEEIVSCAGTGARVDLKFARAVIAADREKNR